MKARHQAKADAVIQHYLTSILISNQLWDLRLCRASLYTIRIVLPWPVAIAQTGQKHSKT